MQRTPMSDMSEDKLHKTQHNMIYVTVYRTIWTESQAGEILKGLFKLLIKPVACKELSNFYKIVNT